VAVGFRFPRDGALDLVGFAWSPLFEAVLSLRAITRPKRTPMHLPWVRRCRELLDPALVAEIHDLTHAFDGAVPGIFEVGLAGDSPGFEDELEAFLALEDDLVAYELSLALGGYGCGPVDGRGPSLVEDPTYRDEVIAAASANGTANADLARVAFDDPGALRDRFARLLERYWRSAFDDEWRRLLPRIEAEVTDGARALVTGGVHGLVETLLPEGRWDGDGSAITVDRSWDAVCDVAARGGLTIVPTVYGWPRVLIEMNEPWPLAIFVPLRDLRRPEVTTASDREVADGLRALGEETRLQITRLIAEQPRSTTELAALLRLSDSAVSRHLKILEAAELVSKARDGYFVLYRLRPERIGQLGSALRRTLGLAHGGAEDVPALPVTIAGETPAGHAPSSPSR
jgi:DNA-binding transcriptional ArsR family regulator